MMAPEQRKMTENEQKNKNKMILNAILNPEMTNLGKVKKKNMKQRHFYI